MNECIAQFAKHPLDLKNRFETLLSKGPIGVASARVQLRFRNLVVANQPLIQDQRDQDADLEGATAESKGVDLRAGLIISGTRICRGR